jgi:hypothetical protein
MLDAQSKVIYNQLRLLINWRGAFMSQESMIILIPPEIWQDFKYVAPVDEDEEVTRQRAAFIMVGALSEYVERRKNAYPYQTLHLQGGGWNVFFVEDDKEPRLNDTHPEAFPEKQKHNADRLRKSLNQKWHRAMRDSEDIMKANNGALIV